MASSSRQKPILITGCSSGIGYCVAKGLQARGYRVFATARRETDVARLRSEGLESAQLDLDDSSSIQAAVSEILSLTNDKLYGLFNNAGYGQPGAVEDLRRDVLANQFETNVFGTLDLTNRVLPVMRRQGYGRIIQNSSVLGFVSLAFRGAYNASKYALEGLYDTLRLELENTEIYPILIEPGPIESRFRANALLMYKQHIDGEQSAHRDTYARLVQRLATEGQVVPFTLPPEAVLKKVVHALESRRPRPRYYVTFPTYLFGALKRLLSTSALDRILFKISQN